MKGIPQIAAQFGEKDANPFAPLHRRLGIATHVRRQAVLNDPRLHAWDPISRTYSHQHLFRQNITLAGAA